MMTTAFQRLRMSETAPPLPPAPSRRVKAQMNFHFYYRNTYLHQKICFIFKSSKSQHSILTQCILVFEGTPTSLTCTFKVEKLQLPSTIRRMSCVNLSKHFICSRWHLLKHLVQMCVLHKQVLPHECKLQNNVWAETTLHCIQESHTFLEEA